MKGTSLTATLVVLSLLGLGATESQRFLATAGPAAEATTAAVARVDLTTDTGLAALAATWRYHDAVLAPVTFRAAQPNGQPGAVPSAGFDIVPRAGAVGFDDSEWPPLTAASLAERRGPGKVSFGWYRLTLTIPAELDGTALRGTTALFEASLDDYAEVWVDGELSRCSGQEGGSVVAGWNATNRVIAARDVRPGQKLHLAIFGINGPISGSPTNYIYLRSAQLSFVHASMEPVALTMPCEVNVEVERLDPALDEVISVNPKLYKLAEGFTFTEGPLWDPRDGGALLFSDPNENRIYRYAAKHGLSVHREASGYRGDDIARYRQPGSNGLAFDPQGRLVIDQHGQRRVARLDDDGVESVVVDRFDGRRLNSPNDLIFDAEGTLYFTDPPFGLPGFEADPAKELPSSGVFALDRGGKLTRIDDSLKGPNGIALGPDGRTLYVGNWDPQRKVVVRYVKNARGGWSAPEVVVDLTAQPGDVAIDGVKVDAAGRLYISGPGGLWVASPAGKLLGRIQAPRGIHNMAWGDDGRTLYLTAETALYRLPLQTLGYAPHLAWISPDGAKATRGATTDPFR